jgi:hypothetical protein
MGRWAKRAALGALVLAVVLSAPIVWIETACTARRAPDTERVSLVRDPGYARRESDSYLSFPEWHIVYAYEDLAGVLGAADASRFAYRGQIAGFWRSLCRLTRVASARGAVGSDTKVMLYTIGWSFTAELGLKGAYETTVGRLFEWLRGPERTAEDTFVARDMQAYAGFLRQTPWYEYPFAARLGDFWRTTPGSGPHLPRKLERRGAVTLEYGVKAGYGALIGIASNTALGAADLEIMTVVVALEASDVAADPRIAVVRGLGGGLTLIRTPRYQAYTEVLVGLARRGRNIAEIAGNHRILVTALMPPGPWPAVPGATELFQIALQSRPERRLALDVAVESLGAAIRTLEGSRAVIEHVYDY